MSIVHVYVAGDWSALPAASVARTRNSCDPAARPVWSRGDVQAANAAPSSEQANVEPDSLEREAEARGGEPRGRGGLEVIVVCGAVVSGAWTVQVRVSASVSRLPAASVARTRKVC